VQTLQVALTPPNQRLVQQIGFNALSVIVDNPTNAYWFLPDQLRFIAPFVSGVIIPLGGVESCPILYQAPPTIQQPAAPVLSAAANFTFYDLPLGPDSGLSLAANAFGRAVSLINLTFQTPQTTFVFVQPAPDGFLIIPQTGVAGTFTLFADLDHGGSGLFFKKVWYTSQYTPNTQGIGQLMNVRYKRPVPAQSVLALGSSGTGTLPAILVI
jgi:hypothetical protein